MPIKSVNNRKELTVIRPVCAHHGVRIGCLIAILRQNAYMHEQITKEFEGRKHMYECTPFGYVNLCIAVTHYFIEKKKADHLLKGDFCKGNCSLLQRYP